MIGSNLKKEAAGGLVSLVILIVAVVLTVSYFRGDLGLGVQMAYAAISDGPPEAGMEGRLSLLVHVVYGLAIAFLFWKTGLWPSLASLVADVRTIVAYWSRVALERLAAIERAEDASAPEDPIVRALRDIDSNVTAVAADVGGLKDRMGALEERQAALELADPDAEVPA